MQNQEGYNQWSASYDEVENKTRDLEAKAMRAMLSGLSPKYILELGCGTGKNTAWLIEKATMVFAVDFSNHMLEKAKQKINSDKLQFVKADIRLPWQFIVEKVQLITCSLVLEHIRDIQFIFEQAYLQLHEGGHFYIGELHPFKQYLGSKARFDSGNTVIELECFPHAISEYLMAAKQHHFQLIEFREWMDEEDSDVPALPRIATFLFEKKTIEHA